MAMFIHNKLQSIFTPQKFISAGYGNIAPKTPPGRVFCIFYGLFGVPLCFTWISELGKFFGGRAKHLGKYLTKKGVTLVRSKHTLYCIVKMIITIINK